MKKGISAIMTMLITMVTVLVAFIIFSSLSSGAFLQEKALITKQVGVTGEIPCTKSPDVQFTNTVEGATYINPPKNIISTPQNQYVQANTSLNAKISSSCVEDLDVAWSFGDGNITEENCTYVPGQGYYVVDSSGNTTDQNCASMNHTYAVNLSDIWTIKDIRLQVFGLRSAFYSEATAAGFVTDPNFNISIKSAPDTNDYSCVLLDVIANNSKYAISEGVNETINNLRLDAVDNKRIRSAETTNYLSGNEAKFTYRAYSSDTEIPGRTNHNVQVFATKGYQTVNSSAFSYVTPSNINPRKEIMVYASGDNRGLDVWYNSSSNNQWACVENSSKQCAWWNTPQLTDKETPIAVASADVNGDGEAEIITLMQGVGSNPSELFEFKNSEFPRTADFRNTTMDGLKYQWVYTDLPKGTWRDVAIGNIKVGGRLITNAIIALSDDSLAVYQVQGQNIVLISEGTDLPKKGTLQIDHWVGLTTANMNGDGEDEIIAIARGDVDKNWRDKVFVFDYNDYSNLNLVEGIKGGHLLSNPGSQSWVGVVAGDFDGEGKKDDIMAMAGSDGHGDLMLYRNVEYGKGIQSVGTTDFISKFPNVHWQNVITADMNGGGKDELVTLYESDGDDEVCIFNSADLFVLHNDDYWNYINDNLNNLKGKTNPTCMALDGSTDFGWKSLAVGDVGCFQ